MAWHLAWKQNKETLLPSLLNNLNFLGLSASAKILLTPSVGKYIKLLAAIELNKTVIDAAINTPQVKAKLEAQYPDFMQVWPYVSLGLDISTITAEHMLGFMKSRKAVVEILRREGKEEAAGKLEELEPFVDYSDELKDALRLTRSKFVKCGCGDELTDALADRVKNKLTNAEINELDEAFANVDLRNEFIQDPDLIDVWKSTKILDADLLKKIGKIIETRKTNPTERKKNLPTILTKNKSLFRKGKLGLK